MKRVRSPWRENALCSPGGVKTPYKSGFCFCYLEKSFVCYVYDEVLVVVVFMYSFYVAVDHPESIDNKLTFCIFKINSLNYLVMKKSFLGFHFSYKCLFSFELIGGFTPFVMRSNTCEYHDVIFLLINCHFSI